MIIINHDVDLEGTQAGTAKWLDPVIESQVAQFKEETCHLAALHPDERPQDIDAATFTAEHLCDGSREIVYRMHRVTKKQLEEAADAFDVAAALVGAWQLDGLSKERRELIQAYGLHIRKRAQLLRKQLR